MSVRLLRAITDVANSALDAKTVANFGLNPFVVGGPIRPRLFHRYKRMRHL